jgi:hypothetical protein
LKSLRKFSEEHVTAIRVAGIIAATINLSLPIRFNQYVGLFFFAYMILVPASYIAEALVKGKVE